MEGTRKSLLEVNPVLLENASNLRKLPACILVARAPDTENHALFPSNPGTGLWQHMQGTTHHHVWLSGWIKSIGINWVKENETKSSVQ